MSRIEQGAVLPIHNTLNSVALNNFLLQIQIAGTENGGNFLTSVYIQLGQLMIQL